MRGQTDRDKTNSRLRMRCKSAQPPQDTPVPVATTMLTTKNPTPRVSVHTRAYEGWVHLMLKRVTLHVLWVSHNVRTTPRTVLTPARDAYKVERGRELQAPENKKKCVCGQALTACICSRPRVCGEPPYLTTIITLSTSQLHLTNSDLSLAASTATIEKSWR